MHSLVKNCEPFGEYSVSDDIIPREKGQEEEEYHHSILENVLDFRSLLLQGRIAGPACFMRMLTRMLRFRNQQYCSINFFLGIFLRY